MVRPVKFILFTVILYLLLICGLMAIGLIQSIYNHGPEVLFGQRIASHETKPLPPRAYASAEFVLGQVPLSEVEQTMFVYLPQDALFWDPDYLGFPQTVLQEADLSQLHDTLSTAQFITADLESGSYDCVLNDLAGKAHQISCSQGAMYYEKIQDIKGEATLNQQLGVLLIQLKDGRLAQIHIYWSKASLVISPYEKAGPWWIEGLAIGWEWEIERWVKSTTIQPIPELWPELRQEAANALVARRLGQVYWRAYQHLETSTLLITTLDRILEIRPAAGMNYSSSWMDSRSSTLTLKVTGMNGEAAVLMRGDECFEGEFVFRGKIYALMDDTICP